MRLDMEMSEVNMNWGSVMETLKQESKKWTPFDDQLLYC